MKTLAAAAAAAVFGFAVPAAAGATTLVGSGSVAAQPVFEALFHKYEKLHKDIEFVYTANGGNVGVQDVQAGRSQFAGQARSPLPSDAGTTYIKMYLDGVCIDVHPSNQVSNIDDPGARGHLPRRTSRTGPTSRVEPDLDDQPGRP